ncbi:hypothetical protein ACHAXT_005908 [Thalassiosira profunda]
MGLIFSSYSAPAPVGAEEDVDFSGSGGDPVETETTPGSPTKQQRVLERNWDVRFDQLVEYKQRRGHVRVYPSYKVKVHPHGEIRLGKWLENQKHAFRKNRLPLHRYEKLRSVGVRFGKKTEDADLALEEQTPAKRNTPPKRTTPKSVSPKTPTDLTNWEERLQLLVEYKQENGDVRVPATYNIDGVRLGKWLENQKGAFRRGKLKPDRLEQLRSVGVELGETKVAEDGSPIKAARSPRAKSLSPKVENQWESQRAKLVAFGAVHGHCHVPSTYKEDQSLAKWVENQRMLFHKGRLTEERKHALEEVGFDYGAKKTDRWDFHLEELKEYREQHGHCDVPQSYDVDGVRLGKWVSKQRVQQKAGRLPREKVDLLQQLEPTFFI